MNFVEQLKVNLINNVHLLLNSKVYYCFLCVWLYPSSAFGKSLINFKTFKNYQASNDGLPSSSGEKGQASVLLVPVDRNIPDLWYSLRTINFLHCYWACPNLWRNLFAAATTKKLNSECRRRQPENTRRCVTVFAVARHCVPYPDLIFCAHVWSAPLRLHDSPVCLLVFVTLCGVGQVENNKRSTFSLK